MKWQKTPFNLKRGKLKRKRMPAIHDPWEMSNPLWRSGKQPVLKRHSDVTKSGCEKDYVLRGSFRNCVAWYELRNYNVVLFCELYIDVPKLTLLKFTQQASQLPPIRTVSIIDWWLFFPCSNEVVLYPFNNNCCFVYLWYCDLRS